MGCDIKWNKFTDGSCGNRIHIAHTQIVSLINGQVSENIEGDKKVYIMAVIRDMWDFVILVDVENKAWAQLCHSAGYRREVVKADDPERYTLSHFGYICNVAAIDMRI